MKIINKKKIKILSGFTLIEVIVALSIFGIASTAALSIFVRSNEVQKRTANIQRLISDARYTLEVMAREVRMGYIDYEYGGYGEPLDSFQEELAIRDENDQLVRFRKFEIEPGRNVVQVCNLETCNPGDWYDITPEDLSVEQLGFYLAPPRDPFIWDNDLVNYPFDVQPLVTIVMQTKSTYRDSDTPKISNFQTTVTSRIYVR